MHLCSRCVFKAGLKEKELNYILCCSISLYLICIVWYKLVYILKTEIDQCSDTSLVMLAEKLAHVMQWGSNKVKKMSQYSPILKKKLYWVSFTLFIFFICSSSSSSLCCFFCLPVSPVRREDDKVRLIVMFPEFFVG